MRSLGLINRCVVTQLKQVDVLVGIVVEQDGGASLALEVDAVLFLIGHLGDLNLDLGALSQHSVFLCLLVLGDLLLDGEVDLPGVVGELIRLVLLLELGDQVVEEAVGAVMGEESVRVRLVGVEIHQSQTDDLVLGANFFVDLLTVGKVYFTTDLEVTTGLVANLVALSLLTLGLLKGALLVNFVAIAELFTDGIGVGDVAVGEPGVADEVSDAETLVRVELKHASDQIFEVLRVEALGLASGVAVSLPEKIAPVGSEKLVVVVLFVGHLEGRVTRVEDEEDDAEGEQVDDLTLVGLLLKDFRSHVAWGSNHGAIEATTVTALEGAGEAEIDNFDVIHFVEKDVLRLEVAM